MVFIFLDSVFLESNRSTYNTGDNTYFQCKFKKTYIPYKVIWYRQRGEENKVIQSDGVILNLTDIGYSNIGVYSCKINVQGNEYYSYNKISVVLDGKLGSSYGELFIEMWDHLVLSTQNFPKTTIFYPLISGGRKF